MTEDVPRRSNEALFEMAQEEYERASRRLDDGTLTDASLIATVRRLHDVAEMITDPALRAVVIGDAEELRAAPEGAREAARGDEGDARREASAELRDAQGLVAWAWEDLPDVEARRARVRDALRRIQRMPEPNDAAEHREMSELQAQLMRLDSALGAG